jgi:fructokinase
VREVLDVPFAFDTDVNGAALGEYRWGASQGMDPSIYFTIGTGIGAGVIVNGKPVHGLVHPETGHIPLPHDQTKDPFPGSCPFHQDCFEGLAAGPALLARWGQRAETLPVDHPAWDLEADYIAAAMVSQICSLSPRRIILGGGVMQQPALFPLIWKKVPALLNGYVQSKSITEDIQSYIVPPGPGTRSGVMGAIALAMGAVGM